MGERCGDDHHHAARRVRIEGATEEGVQHIRWTGTKRPKKIVGELQLDWKTCSMCNVGHCSYTLPLCSLPHMDLWQVVPFRRPPRVSDTSKSRVRVVLFDTLCDPLWRVFGSWLFTENGYGACTKISSEYEYVPEKHTRGIPLQTSYL